MTAGPGVPAIRRWLTALLASLLAACAPVGPDFVRPKTETPPDWATSNVEEFQQVGLQSSPHELVEWWRIFDDPVLDELVDTARRQNNTLEIAGLAVLEARAQLGIATGSSYPQVQVATGNANYVSPADNAGGGSGFWSYGLGASAQWEIDFWGRFRRGIESADAAFLASIAAYDQAQVLLTATVVSTYATVRSLEEQLRIAQDNVDIQQRSFEIAELRYREGQDSELDKQQALTLLLATRATIPSLEASLKQARNALSTLLGRPPGSVEVMLARGSGIPVIPGAVTIGFPADMLRRRPDVRQAELLARSANALVGLAEADLYPSFSLTGSIGLSAGGPGDSDFGDLFDAGALTWSAGASFVWPFLNYGRIKNNIRVQDARLQQALVNYREVVLQAAREAEDAMADFIGRQEQQDILEQTVASAIRSNDLSVLRYSEGFSDYQRVLQAQQALFNQQTRYVSNQGDAVRSLVELYKALGGGWENRDGLPYVDPETLQLMQERTDWGSMIEYATPEEERTGTFQKVDW